jgi:hypothetical protein
MGAMGTPATEMQTKVLHKRALPHQHRCREIPQAYGQSHQLSEARPQVEHGRLVVCIDCATLRIPHIADSKFYSFTSYILHAYMLHDT